LIDGQPLVFSDIDVGGGSEVIIPQQCAQGLDVIWEHQVPVTQVENISPAGMLDYLMSVGLTPAFVLGKIMKENT
jgi:hypothetical protein